MSKTEADLIILAMHRPPRQRRKRIKWLRRHRRVLRRAEALSKTMMVCQSGLVEQLMQAVFPLPEFDCSVPSSLFYADLIHPFTLPPILDPRTLEH